MCTAHSRGERGQVLSSVVAVAAVVAVVIGLLVLFGTGGPGGGSDDKTSSSTTPTTAPSSVPSSAPPATSTVTTTATATTTAPPVTVRPSTAPTSEHTSTQPTQQPTERRTALGPRPSVEIYNNTTQRGLADRISRRAEANGWRVAGIDNWRGKVATSTVYYPLGMRDHATELASDLGVGRVKEALSNMKKDRLTVILTSDYSG